MEGAFPFRELSELARADHALPDPVYAAHKWWARRPRSAIRALVLAAHLPSSTAAEDFWELFGSDAPILKGRHVGDPFHGGGTTMVEAARLGAAASGTDVDPLAVRITRDELAPTTREQVEAAARELLDHLRNELEPLYPSTEDGTTPLHYFRMRSVTCPSCRHESLLHRTPVLARDEGRSGAVVRDGKQTVFCPACRCVRGVSANAKSFSCCRRRWRLTDGTFSRSGFVCAACGARRTLRQLLVGRLPDLLVAVEDTVEGGRRRLRAPNEEDLAALAEAAGRRERVADRLPDDSLDGVDGGRAQAYGFQTVADLFADRQAVVLVTAFEWLREAELVGGLRARLELAVSNAVSSNNRLCGYATDYGRLAPAFTGVRSYSFPILSVELNPLHPTAGRGTLAATLRRVERSAAATVRRVVRRKGEFVAVEMTGRRTVDHHVSCRSADRPFPGELGSCSAIVTDPPYYDFIAYSDLSLLHRAWLQADNDDGLAGAPIYPLGDDGHENFTRRLGRALRNSSRALANDGVIAFTYHSVHEPAWSALTEAVAAAGLTVTATFPLWADARSSVAHGHPGSCEWDLVWVCRPIVRPARLPESIDAWQLNELSEPDRTNLSLGLAAAHAANRARSH